MKIKPSAGLRGVCTGDLRQPAERSPTCHGFRRLRGDTRAPRASTRTHAMLGRAHSSGPARLSAITLPRPLTLLRPPLPPHPAPEHPGSSGTKTHACSKNHPPVPASRAAHPHTSACAEGSGTSPSTAPAQRDRSQFHLHASSAPAFITARFTATGSSFNLYPLSVIGLAPSTATAAAFASAASSIHIHAHQRLRDPRQVPRHRRHPPPAHTFAHRIVRPSSFSAAAAHSQRPVVALLGLDRPEPARGLRHHG